jgi:hypothetical protein
MACDAQALCAFDTLGKRALVACVVGGGGDGGGSGSHKQAIFLA